LGVRVRVRVKRYLIEALDNDDRIAAAAQITPHQPTRLDHVHTQLVLSCGGCQIERCNMDMDMGRVSIEMRLAAFGAAEVVSSITSPVPSWSSSCGTAPFAFGSAARKAPVEHVRVGSHGV
jgi:hypothetical protein